MSGPYMFTATDIRALPVSDYFFETQNPDGQVIGRGRTKGTFQHQVWRIRKCANPWLPWTVFPIEPTGFHQGFETFDGAIRYATTYLPGASRPAFRAGAS